MPKKIIKPEIRTLDKETGEIIVTPEVSIEEREPIDVLIRRGFKALFFKTPHNHNTLEAARHCATYSTGIGKCQAHQAAETEINGIMKRFGVTGVLPGSRTPPVYMDVPEDLDMQKAIHLVRAGEEEFMRQPAIVRAYFKNDMANYTATVNHMRKTGDKAGLQSLGLIPPDTPKPTETAVEPKTPKTPPDPKGPPPKGDKD